MSTARDRMLAAVRTGLMSAELPDASPERPADLPARAAQTVEAMVTRFTTDLTALTGEVHHAQAITDLADAIAGIAATYSASDYLSWHESALGWPGLIDILTSRGLRRVTYDLPFDQAGRDADVRALAEVGFGLTGSDAAISEGGGIVLVSGPGRGRLASLLPPVHVAIVRTSQLYPSLPDLLAARPDLVDRGSNVTIVAGPSRTADIEMTLTHGVHGPKRVHAILTA